MCAGLLLVYSPAVPARPALPAGSVFAGRFEILRPLSSDGSGRLYLARERGATKELVLSLLPSELLPDASATERFGAHVRSASLVGSAHVARVVGAGVDVGRSLAWTARELLLGEDLGSAIAARGPLPLNLLEETFEQLTHALSAAHAEGFAHGSLDPTKVWLTYPSHAGARLTVKVVDLGVASAICAGDRAAMTLVGSPLWMAPEQLAAQPEVGGAADLWALGLLAFFALTGRIYWLTAEEPLSLGATALGKPRAGALPSATARVRELGLPERLPPGFDEWFHRCVTPDLRMRFETATAAHAALRAVLHDASEDGSRAPLEQLGPQTEVAPRLAALRAGELHPDHSQTPPVATAIPQTMPPPTGALGAGASPTLERTLDWGDVVGTLTATSSPSTTLVAARPGQLQPSAGRLPAVPRTTLPSGMEGPGPAEVAALDASASDIPLRPRRWPLLLTGVLIAALLLTALALGTL